MNSTVNIGVIGAGYWGPNLVRNFSSIDGCEVRYVCDLDEGRLAKIQSAYPLVRTTTSYTTLISDPEVHAIAIATPVFTHFELAYAALSAGKHVLLEKPMASTVKECDTLIELARSKGVHLLIDHTFLYTSAVSKIKELVDAGVLGDLYYFDSERINLGLIQPDVNVLWDLAPHDISIMNYLFEGSRPVSVFAAGTQHVTSNAHEMAHLTINYDSGLVGHIHASWLSPVKIRKILIGGSKKMVLYNDMEPSEKIRIYDKSVEVDLSTETPSAPVYRSGDIVIPALENSEALAKEARHFVACVRGSEKPFVDGEQGRDVIRILTACDESLRTGKVVPLV